MPSSKKIIIDRIVLILESMSESKSYYERFFQNLTSIKAEQATYHAIQSLKNENNNIIEIDYKENSHAFPDIVVRFSDSTSLGIEVKSSIQNKSNPNDWTIIGNSILGSTRIDVDETYVIFIKSNKSGIFIKSARYEDAIANVVVTHSPRYLLNLTQDPKESFFALSGINYYELKSSNNPISIITDYFRKKGETAWWLSNNAPPTIKMWNELSRKEQDNLLTLAFIFFPEIIVGASNTKYKRMAIWLITEHSTVNISMRDSFSAGGRTNINFGRTKELRFSQVYSQLIRLRPNILTKLKTIDLDELLSHWPTYDYVNDSYINRKKYWSRQLINNHSTPEEINLIEDLVNEINVPQRL